MEKFPDLDVPLPRSNDPSPTRSNGSASRGMRRDASQGRGVRWLAASHSGPSRHTRQKSLGDAFRTIRSRNGSVSQNAHEIADALRAPLSPKLIILCVAWYTSSALTNTTSKSILNAFDKPATLTLIQFAFVSSLCVLMAWLATVFPVLRSKITALKYPIRAPTRDVIMTTLPLAAFQIGGHLLSSTATAKIPVSLVHTIKGLSPLFTVSAYRFVYDIRYPRATYYSLIPLTAGVMLACSGKSGVGGQLLGVIEAFLATIIFVTQNIFSKKLFNEAAKAEADHAMGGAQSKKLDKLNLLCYSSGMAFVLTLPIWFWSEGIGLMTDFFQDGFLDLSNKPNAMDHGRLTVEFIFNGVCHFGQNILAFILLSMVSPVTYSVASLIKRVFVIVMAIIWFRNPTTKLQAVGIALTFLGLYLYDRTSESNKADRKARMMAQTPGAVPLLPVSSEHGGRSTGTTPLGSTPTGHPYTEGYFSSANGTYDSKKTDESTLMGNRGGPSGDTKWFPPGTKQEDTWRANGLPPSS
ncbi:hypothetical protein NLU13_6762 [Sarocladium strictum]|uniref:Sugar phosphate transporter domain-containing protein n=1 Tax=Sarocladium strictum TaxID=5046 RepID=A0AA39GFG6_SARSR|nr:hypothetical protein NLU13_6762 [Sarocladium strictum]